MDCNTKDIFQYTKYKQFNMIYLLIIFSIIFGILLYIKSFKHPKNFPPGPRLPFPIIGDIYKLRKDFPNSLRKLTKEYGKIYGFWFGGKRAVIVADFDVLQDILNKKETVDRPPMQGAGKLPVNIVAVLNN